MEFDFYSPVKLIFGRPAVEALPGTVSDIGAQRVLLLSDAGLLSLGVVDPMVQSLRSAGAQVALFTGVRSNPTTRDLDAALEAARDVDAEAIVALGGGSVVDVGKGVGLLMSNGGRYADYQWGEKPITRPILPLIAIPTTAGTGSEMTHTAVIEDEETRFKKGVLSPHMFARAALLDPTLTLSLPSHLTAATGADVFGHALEAYLGRRANPITDALALTALRFTWENLPKAVHQGDDLGARERMLLSSSMAGCAFDGSGLGIIHALAGPLAAHYELHHGLTVGMLIPYGLAFNLPAIGDRRAALLDALHLPADIPDAEVLHRVRAWLEGIGIPSALPAVGIEALDAPALAAEAMRMAMMPNNPRAVSEEDCIAIYGAMRA